MAATKKPDSTLVAVPRRWLFAFAALLVLPWLVIGVFVLRRPAQSTIPFAAAGTDLPSQPAGAGPWGRLTVTPIVISPPLEYVAPDWARQPGPDQWMFPQTSPELLHAFLSSTGLTREEVSRLESAARPDGRIRGLVITPDPELIRTMRPEVRGRLYSELAKTQLNFDQANSFRFFGDTPDVWLHGSLMSPKTREIVEPLIYRQGSFMHFADVEYVRSQIPDPAELQRLAKTLLRQTSMLVKLSVEDASQVPALSDYWGRGGRRTDVRPLLESIAGSNNADRSIDIVHLLPTFARNNLYRYPKVTTADLDKSLLANCLWTSLNFFRAQPDSRFLEVDFSLNALRTDYYVVEHAPQLGDIVGFVDAEGDLFHAAVFLADDLVFTKNGMSVVAPWIIMPIERLKEYYRHGSGQVRLIYHRRNDL